MFGNANSSMSFSICNSIAGWARQEAAAPAGLGLRCIRRGNLGSFHRLCTPCWSLSKVDPLLLTGGGVWIRDVVACASSGCLPCVPLPSVDPPQTIWLLLSFWGLFCRGPEIKSPSTVLGVSIQAPDF